jgi:serine phosphatase RsbU (regulator of sigma subunit)
VNRRTIALIVVVAVLVAVRLAVKALRSHQQNGVARWVTTVADALWEGRPSGTNPYWRTVPVRRTKRLLAGTFLLSSVAGFAVNLIVSPTRLALLHGFFWPLFLSVFSTSLLVVSLKRPGWAFYASLIGISAFLMAYLVQLRVPELPGLAIARRDLLFDALGTLFGAALGSRLIMSFLTTEGVASVRMQTELTLAQGIQATLVPPISLKTSRFEIFGISLPSTEVGGDLVDAILSDEGLLAYVADISGHGLPAGQLMGMLKTAMRVSLELKQPPTALLENADRVLPSLKEPDMYATLALLRFDHSPAAEYCLAGHPPILHYRKHSNDVARLTMQQFPIGLIGDARYTSARTQYSPGDLFLILTDGITEVADERGEEFGLERVERLVVSRAAHPLPEIWELIRNAVIAFGPQRDDQSALMIRAL